MTDRLVRMLADAPDSQISPAVKLHLVSVKTADDMKAVLDRCAAYGLASDFAMQAMDLVWKMMLKDEAENE